MPKELDLPCSYISFINSRKAKDYQKSELNHCTSQEPNGEKAMNKVSVLDVGGKPQRVVLGKTHAVRQGLKTQSTVSRAMESDNYNM